MGFSNRLKTASLALFVVTALSFASFGQENNPAACKMQAARWSGSGELVAYDFDERGVFGAVIKTNGHVAPQVGMQLDAIFRLPSGTDRAFTFTTKTVLYNSRTTLDVAWGHVPGLLPDSGIKPVAQSQERLDDNPSGLKLQTTGSPGGVWPLQTYDLTVQRMVTPTVVGWLPNARAGQSGSGVRELLAARPPPKPYSPEWSFDPDWIDRVTLTWTWNNLGAGVDTGFYWSIVSAATDSERTGMMATAPERPPGLIELAARERWQDRGLRDGYFNVAGHRAANPNAKPWNPATLNMWYRPDEGVEPPPDDDITPAELAAVKDAKAVGLDIVAVLDFHVSLMATKTLGLNEPELSFGEPIEFKLGENVLDWSPPVRAKGDPFWTVGLEHKGKQIAGGTWVGKKDDVFYVWADIPVSYGPDGNVKYEDHYLEQICQRNGEPCIFEWQLVKD